MNSFVISQFNYCPIIWMSCQRHSNNSINRIHEKAYHDYISIFEGLLDMDDSITIHQRNIQAIALELYKATMT